MPFTHPQMGSSKPTIGFQNTQLKFFGIWMLLDGQSTLDLSFHIKILIMK